MLSDLDECYRFTFPMLDNGYFYLAATRMSLYRSPEDWALVIEVLVIGDVSLYRLSLPPNTHWKNWPDVGTL